MINTGQFLKEDVAKMVFMIQKVPSSDASITYEAYSYCQNIMEYYDYIMNWAVDDET